MEILRPLPFPLFPRLFPALFAVWVMEEGIYPPDDEDLDEFPADGSVDPGGSAAPDGSVPPDDARPAPATPRRPLSARTRRTVPILFRLLDTRAAGGFPQLLTDPRQVSDILDGLLRSRITYDDLEDVAVLRDRLCTAVTTPDILDVHDLLNELALQHGVTPQIAGDGHLTHTTAFADVASDVAAVVVPAVMELHARGWADRVRECAALDCWSLYLDLSNGGHQRHCTAACAARERTRRRRGRLRQPPEARPGPRLER
jgi:hypothetical protein